MNYLVDTNVLRDRLKNAKAGTDLRAVRENGKRMNDHELISELPMDRSIRLPFAGPLRRTVPAIFKTVSK